MFSSPETRPYSSINASFTWGAVSALCQRFDYLDSNALSLIKRKLPVAGPNRHPSAHSEKHCLTLDNLLKNSEWVGSARVGDSLHLWLEQIILLGGMTTPKFSDEESLIAKSPPSNFGSLTRENFRPFTWRFLHYQ